MNKCVKCGESVEPQEVYEYAGETLCEDCYLERMAKPTTCDPWAVYSAKKTTEKGAELTDIQQRILDLLKEKKPLEARKSVPNWGSAKPSFRTTLPP